MKKTIILITILFFLAFNLLTSVSAQNIPWNWSGVVGTGQSLSVGAEASPGTTTTQPFNNLKISLEGVAMPPFDPNNSLFKMVPLVEPIRVYGYWAPSAYPGNIFGETPHSCMANQITYLVQSAYAKDYITVHTVVGESGQGIDALSKDAVDTGSAGRAFAATLFEVTANKRLAAAAGKTYGVGAIIITHGETDSGNTNYENELYTLWYDYNQDLKAITGQTQMIPLFVTQQHSCGTTGTSVSTIAQWKVGVDYPGNIVCAGPNYYYPYAPDGVHLVASGYQQLGEKYGKVYYQKLVLGNNWQPLQPTSISLSGRVITVNFNVPVPPLVWDTIMPAPNASTQTEWVNGKGFEVISNNNYERLTISSVAISGNSVLITCAADLPAVGANVGYAYTSGGTKRTNGTYRWGLLRDSDPFVGYTTKIAQPNYCVSFVLPVPMGASTATPATATRTATLTATVSRTATVTATTITRTGTATRTPTATRTSTTITRTATRTATTGTASRTATTTVTATSVVTATASSTGSTTCTCDSGCSTLVAITPNFTKEGTGQFCYSGASLGSYINSWNLTALKVNGVDLTNKWTAAASLPLKIGGLYYVYYNSAVTYGHFEAMN